jgi:hypothetical protein
MDKKLLMKVGIGAGVLVLGYLAYKKFFTKTAETKSAEAEEATTDEATETGGTKSSEAAETTPVTPRTTKNITTTATPAQDLVSSPPPREKQGITKADLDKMNAEGKRLKKLGGGRKAIEQGLRDFAQQNRISYIAWEQFRERNAKTMEANQFAGFMDLDAQDIQGQMM